MFQRFNALLHVRVCSSRPCCVGRHEEAQIRGQGVLGARVWLGAPSMFTRVPGYSRARRSIFNPGGFKLMDVHLGLGALVPQPPMCSHQVFDATSAFATLPFEN